MAQDPFRNTRERERRRQGEYSLGLARVVSVPDSAGHQIAIQPLTQTGPQEETSTKPSSASVMVAERGDIALPSVGDLVVFGRFANRRNVVLGAVYSDQTAVRDHSSEERHIGSDGGRGVFFHGDVIVPPRLDEAPQQPPDGSVWYRTDLGEFRGVEDGTRVSFDTTPV